MAIRPSAYAEIQDYLFSLKARGAKFGIDRMRLLAAALGHPERTLPYLHVAGTNGKGSVAAMLEAVFRSAGWRTGLYTSPHLVRLGERVRVDGKILTEEEIMAYTRELRPVADRLAQAGDEDDRPSFFEFMTAMAFLQFNRQRCDLGIAEVGMGGRLDATNILDPEVSIITSIALDHVEFLGGTIEQIAAEKAGIIKPGRPVVLGRMPAEAERVIRQVARERGARVLSVWQEFGDAVAGYPQTNLEGDYQRWNAGTAVLAASLLPASWRLTAEAVTRGLLAVDWPGRWQRTQVGGRLLVLDASHNPEGAQTLETNLARLVQETGQKPVVVVGALGIARAAPLLATVCRHAREVQLVVPEQSRACSHAELVSLVPPDFSGPVVRATVAGLFPGPGVCTAGGRDDVIVVTGSIYLLGEVLARLEPQRGAGEGRLQDF